MFLKNVKTAGKLWTLLGVALGFLVATGGVGSYYSNQIAHDAQSMYKDRLLPMQWANEVRSDHLTVDTDLLELMQTDSDAENIRLNQAIANLDAQTDSIIANYESLPLTAAERDMLQDYKNAITPYRAARAKVMELAMVNRNDEAVQSFVQNVVPLRDQVNQMLLQFVQFNEKQAEDLNQASTADASKSLYINLSLLLFALLMLVAIGTLISRMITKPLSAMQTLMAKARRGDLTVRGTYQSRDELGRVTTDFNEMMQEMQGIMSQIRETSMTLSASAEELSATTSETSHATEEITLAVQDVAQGAEIQLRGAEETNQTMKEMAQGIQRVADSASTATSTSQDATRESETGRIAVEKVVEQMDFIKQAVGTSAEIVQELGTRSQEVGHVVNAISEIASQVNLLALNAAIEAARAGEHGKGFSVVADEVRKLAEQSGAAAESIQEIILTMQAHTERAVEAMHTGTTEVERGIAVVQQAGSSFGRILHMVHEVAEQIEDVSASAEQMSASTQQIAASVESIAEIAHQSAQNSQQVAAASEEQLASFQEVTSSSTQLSQMAYELQEMIAKFKVEDSLPH